MNHLFIVGAQRSGSTYLYEILDSHPQVSMIRPVRPEPKFFMDDKLVGLGREYYEQTYCTNCKDQTHYLGEKSTSYIESLTAARRIRDFYPNARILMILRDPVQRAYSNYRFSVSHGMEDLSFWEALAAESERLKTGCYRTSAAPYAYRERGHYVDYIKLYLTVFAQIQVNILVFEEFVNNLTEIQKLYSWLGLDNGFVPPSLNTVVNPATAQKLDQHEAFKDLIVGYQDSIALLEEWLGRKIESWHESHHAILTSSYR